MFEFLSKTIIATGPKKSGGSLITRLFDSQPGIINFIDEAFFWEHVYNYQEKGQESLFIDTFKRFDRSDLMESFIDRDILPWINGTLLEVAPVRYELDLNFKKDIFLNELVNLRKCSSISEIWNCMVKAYANAMPTDYSECDIAYMFIGDKGRSILSTKASLENCRCIFFVRNPYNALESLKVARMYDRKSVLNRRNEPLHPINFAQVINDYCFIWNNRSEMLDKRTIIIRFEDLVAEPEKTMKAVADHVGIEFTSNLLKPTLLGQPYKHGSFFGSLKGIDKSVIHRKIKALSKIEIEIIGEHLKPILEYFDYTVPEIAQ